MEDVPDFLNFSTHHKLVESGAINAVVKVKVSVSTVDMWTFPMRHVRRKCTYDTCLVAACYDIPRENG